MDDIDELFVVLADPTRRRVIELLSARGCRASDLAEQASVTRTAMSRHLKALRDHGLVTVELSSSDARQRLYRLRHEELIGLQAWLDQVQAQWQDQLASLKVHAEATRPRRDTKSNAR